MSEKKEGDRRKRSSSGVPHVDTKGDPRLGAFPAVDPGSIHAAVLRSRRRAPSAPPEVAKKEGSGRRKLHATTPPKEPEREGVGHTSRTTTLPDEAEREGRAAARCA